MYKIEAKRSSYLKFNKAFYLYLSIFLNSFDLREIPQFLIKYLKTPTMQRIKSVTQFCGCDYTILYNPRFRFTRFQHSLICALMTYHFTHDKKETIKALLHDDGTPCFAHVIDYVFGDYIRQETSEKKLSDIVLLDEELVKYLRDDGIDIYELDDLSDCHILENSHPHLCVDRLDGVLHTCYIWLQTHPLSVIKEVFDNIVVLENEEGNPEIGFSDLSIAEEFVSLVNVYARELQGNKDKYVMSYISEVVKLSFENHLLTLDDLYQKREEDLVLMFAREFKTWAAFASAKEVICTDVKPDAFYVSLDVKKRNTIPLVKCSDGIRRINEVSDYAKKIYDDLEKYHDTKYAYLKEIKRVM